MRKNTLIRGLLALVIVLFVTASAHAFYGLLVRGDYQILQNDKSGAVVRAWVLNTSWCGQFALVTVASKTTDGSRVQGSYTVFVPARSSRPVQVSIASEISTDPTIIVTGLGGN